MKITTLLIMAVALHVSATTLAQKVSLSVKNAQLVDVFNQINSQTGYDFLFSSTIIKNSKPVTVAVNNEELSDVLQKIFAGQSLDFSIENKSVVISAKEKIEVISMVKAPATLYSGKVIDDKGQPLPGVTIRLKGAQNVWTTNKDGQFNLVMIDNKGVLQFSFVGYKTIEVTVANLKNPVTIVLKEAIGSLEEVQVLAYGSTTKRLSTGDVTTFNAKDIEKNPVSNVLQALQNRVPGMFIQQSTGLPGGSFDIKIRGGSSFYSTNPLIIIDGVQFPSGQLPQMAGINRNDNQFDKGSALNYVNPDDIESVSILKDADATALYGSRGAYGVILITTKKAKPGENRLQINAYDGVSVRGVTPTLLNTDQYLMIRKEALKNDGVTPGGADLDLNGTWADDGFTDYRKYYLGATAANQNIDLTYSGGNNQTNFLISGNLRNQGTIEKSTGRDLGGNVRMDVNTTSKNGKFFMDLATTYNLSRNNMTPFDFNIGITAAPNSPPPILPDGSLDWSTGQNAAAAINALYLNTTSNTISSLTARYNFLSHFTLNAQIAYNVLETKEFRALPTSYFQPTTDVNTKTQSNINTFRDRTLSIDPNLQYQNLFFKNLKFDSRLGVTLQDRSDYTLSVAGTNFSSDVLLNSPTSANTPAIASYTGTPGRYAGVFFTSSLNWSDKYLINLNGRRDGSTSFGPGNRFGNFGSVAGAWIVSQEPWMKAIAPIMNFLKFRASYGTVGGDGIPANSYLNLYKTASSPYSGSLGLLPKQLVNPDLHWESKRSEEVGTTIQFLNGRIEIDGSYYRSWTSNVLLPMSVAAITGFQTVFINKPDAKLLTSGYEGTLTATNIQSKSFSWRTMVNLSVPHSKILAFPGLDNYNSVSATNVNFVLGKPVTGIKLFNYAGVNPQTGNYQFINAAGVKADNAFFGTGSLNQATDRTQFIDLAPKYYGGIGNSFSINRFGVDIFMALTRKTALNFYGQGSALQAPGTFNYDPTTVVLDRWQKPGDITNVPKVSQNLLNVLANGNFRSSTGAYSDVTYLRISNVNINYDLGSELLKKLNVKRLSVYLRGQNLWTFSKYKDLDPENMNAYSVGPLRTFVAGFNLTL